MSSKSDQELIDISHDAVSRARTADALVWESPEGGTEFLRERDAAVHAALSDGVDAEVVGSALGVRASDVRRMAEDHKARAAAVG